jgi:hypothetical protein
MQKELRNLLTRVEGWCLRELTKATHRGIRLCDINHNDTDDSAFISRSREALDMIEAKDPRRFRRVQQEICYIVNKELNACGEYHRSTRACFVDFGRYRFDEHPDWYLCLYAGTLVHEATHGLLYSKGFLYTPENREQIERICHAEESRFLTLAKPEWRAQLINEFDPAGWHFAWTASRWAKTKALLRRIRESKKEG